MIVSVSIRYLRTCLYGWILLCFTSSVYANSSTIVVFGDSISAAYGMEENQGWVNLLSQHLDTHLPGTTVVNASVSGETTGGGLVRLEKTLEAHKPDVLILELGGNDGLRGYPIDKIEANLDEMTRLAKEAGATVMLIGMVLPPNYGRRYTSAFEGTFANVAEKYDLPFVPFLLDGVATSTGLIQRDGIHPKPEAQEMILKDVLPTLMPLISESK